MSRSYSLSEITDRIINETDPKYFKLNSRYCVFVITPSDKLYLVKSLSTFSHAVFHSNAYTRLLNHFGFVFDSKTNSIVSCSNKSSCSRKVFSLNSKQLDVFSS